MRRLRLLVLIGSLWPSGARALDKAACVAAAESGQHLRAEARLIAAQEQFLLCADPSCPRLVQVDCAQWVSEVEASMPTVVLYATEGERDLAEVRVQLDGAAWIERLDGKAMALDPGAHRLIFARRGAEQALEVVIVQGEKNRKLVVAFSPPEPTQLVAPGPPPARSWSVPTGSWILGGVGVAALAGFTYLGLSGKSELSALRSGCAPDCQDAQIQPVKNKMLAADLSLVVALLSLGAGTWMFLAQSPE